MAGVSVASASFALNGQPGVADDTRRRILGIAEQLGYRANPNSLLLSSALVLGEFTIAYLLLYTNTLQVTLYSISRNTPNAGVIFSASSAALIFTFLLLLILSYVGRLRRGRG